MTLRAGERLGPYEILGPLGAGGMGVVYRARDKRLGRDVAIKVASDRFSDRFEREARAVAALNHPNICHLYDVGPNYLVMELVEGQAPRGPLPVEEAHSAESPFRRSGAPTADTSCIRKAPSFDGPAAMRQARRNRCYRATASTRLLPSRTTARNWRS